MKEGYYFGHLLLVVWCSVCVVDKNTCFPFFSRNITGDDNIQSPQTRKHEPNHADLLHSFGELSLDQLSFKPCSSSLSAPNQYADYCYDVWNHISKFIAPEDVGRFALICRNTAYITSTSEFWRHMYNQHVIAHKDILPANLQPEEVLNEKKGQRANVIRALFYIHPPFKIRLEKRRLLFLKNYRGAGERTWNSDNLSHNLYLSKILPDCQKLIKQEYFGSPFTGIFDKPKRYHNWIYNIFSFIPKYYFYTFKEKSMNFDQKRLKQRELLFAGIHESEEIYFNPDEYCSILFIKTMKNRRLISSLRPSRFNDTPLNVLRAIKCHETHQSRNRKNEHIRFSNVTLKFQNQQYRQTAIYSDVLKVEVYDWWEPEYGRIQREEY